MFIYLFKLVLYIFLFILLFTAILKSAFSLLLICVPLAFILFMVSKSESHRVPGSENESFNNKCESIVTVDDILNMNIPDNVTVDITVADLKPLIKKGFDDWRDTNYTIGVSNCKELSDTFQLIWGKLTIAEYNNLQSDTTILKLCKVYGNRLCYLSSNAYVLLNNIDDNESKDKLVDAVYKLALSFSEALSTEIKRNIDERINSTIAEADATTAVINMHHGDVDREAKKVLGLED